MPRKRRFFVPDVPVHVVQRGNNRQALFFEYNDYRLFLDWLAEAAGKHGCTVHAYALMTNHVHLLMTPLEGGALSTTLQALGRRFVPYINHSYGRTGTLWEGRFKASVVQEEAYLLTCYRYIEMNPVRARMVGAPEDYPWTSYRANALGEKNALVSPQDLYLARGENPPERQAAYRELVESRVDPDTVCEVRACLQSGTPLGNDRFRAEIERSLGVNAGYSKRGRPKKPVEESGPDADQMDLNL